jgi:hypothetical protein
LVVRDGLNELRGHLQSFPPAEASRVIREFLDSKVDAPTRLGFKVGPGGALSESPSLRVFLLNCLAQLDPAAGAAYAEKILTTMDSPDEWAIALRNYARGNSTMEGRSFLQQKLQTMLTHEPWIREPSAGFLEAFDVAVYVAGVNLLPPLTALVQMKDNEAVAHAAFLALDRMVISQPAEVLTVLEQQPAMMRGREQTRANYFARADLSDAAQRGVVERYLLNPERASSEVQTFAGVFPNANYMISHNLLTSNVTPDSPSLLRRDREALRVAGEWLADPRFEHLRPHLTRIQQRLGDFARQADSSKRR